MIGFINATDFMQYARYNEYPRARVKTNEQENVHTADAGRASVSEPRSRAIGKLYGCCAAVACARVMVASETAECELGMPPIVSDAAPAAAAAARSGPESPEPPSTSETSESVDAFGDAVANANDDADAADGFEVAVGVDAEDILLYWEADTTGSEAGGARRRDVTSAEGKVIDVGCVIDCAAATAAAAAVAADTGAGGASPIK